MLKALAYMLVIATTAAGLLAAPASAKIRCKDGYQIIPGVGLHASPFCEIKYLANIARGSYGITTSFKRLRASMSEREDVCRAIGHDHRVYSICHQYRLDGDQRRWN